MILSNLTSIKKRQNFSQPNISLAENVLVLVLVIVAPVRRKYPNIRFYCFKTALQTTKVRNTLFKANVATTSFALSKIMLKKRITVTDCTRVSSNWIRSNRTKSVPTLKKNSRYNRSSKSFFETFELSCSPKKTLVLFFDAVPNLNRRFHFSLRSLLFLQRGKGESFRWERQQNWWPSYF